MAWSLALAMAVALPGTPPENPGRQLGGTWVSDCTPIGRDDRHGYIATVNFRGDRLGATIQMYARNTCDTPTFRIDYRGDRLQLERRGDRIAIRQRAVSITLTPQDPSVVLIYNRPGGGCGLDNWQLGIARTVAGRACGPLAFPAERATLFDSIWVTGDGNIHFAALPTRWLDNEAAVPGRPSASRFQRRGP